MEESIKSYLENFITDGEKVVRIENEIKLIDQRKIDWEHALKIVTGEVKEEEIDV
jgi:hypothetical protein